MALSEFRYNKKRKHYSYIYGQKGDLRKNLLLSSKSTRKVKKRNGRHKIINNIKLQKHPNPNCKEDEYIMNKRYLDDKNDFGRKLNNWSFDKNDKRIVKRIKKGKKV